MMDRDYPYVVYVPYNTGNISTILRWITDNLPEIYPELRNDDLTNDDVRDHMLVHILTSHESVPPKKYWLFLFRDSHTALAFQISLWTKIMQKFFVHCVELKTDVDGFYRALEYLETEKSWFAEKD